MIFFFFGVYDTFIIYIFFFITTECTKDFDVDSSELGHASWPGSSRRGRPGCRLQEARGGRKYPATCNIFGKTPSCGEKDDNLQSIGDYLYRPKSRLHPPSLLTILIAEDRKAAWTSTCTVSPDETRARTRSRQQQLRLQRCCEVSAMVLWRWDVRGKEMTRTKES